MNYWLIKSEPDEYSIEDLKNEKQRRVPWNGARTEPSRDLLLGEVCEGDQALFFHNNCLASGIAGLVEVLSDPYPCPLQYDRNSHLYESRATKASPVWYVVDIGFQKQFDSVISVPKMKSSPVLADMPLLKQSRLPIQPVSPQQWETIIELG